jgi:hypothetical protein
MLVAVVSALVANGMLMAQEKAKEAAAKPAAAQEVKKGKDVVFDGDKKGENAKGWATPADKATVAAQDKEVRSPGKKTVEFHAAGKEWMGCGWNWFGWYPQDAATDISKYKSLSFWAKLTGDTKPTQLDAKLASNDKKASGGGDLFTYCPDLADGKWHEIVIPIKDLMTEGELNKAKVWEINFGTWSQDDVSFSLFVDEIGFEGTADAATPPAATPPATTPPATTPPAAAPPASGQR